MTHDGMRPRIAAGAKWLDRVFPGWRGTIDTSRLDMARGRFLNGGDDCGCIGAQLDAVGRNTGYFEDFAFDSSLSTAEVVALGLWWNEDLTIEEERAFNRLWIEEIERCE